jgi:predicted nucleotidyltransferase
MVVGITAEYNPLHSGHLYHIRETKKILPGANIICVMSGNFVQRGDIAIADKNARAKAAVMAGADLVFELPVPYALAPAPVCAYGAVYLLNATGVLTHISFGSECGDIRLLTKAAEESSSAEYGESVKKLLAQGKSYASACGGSFSPELSKICSSPNNLLGIEYIRAAKKINENIGPLTVKRIGGGHDDLEKHRLPSATLIRSHILSGKKLPSGALPEFMSEILEIERNEGRFPTELKTLDGAIIAVIKRMGLEELREIPEITEGLEHKLFAAVKTAGSVESLLKELKSKRYTLARLRRIILAAFIGLTKEHQRHSPPYLRLLAAGENGRALLREISQKASVPVITKPAHLNRLGGVCALFAELEAGADSLYSLALPCPAARGDGGFYTQTPYIEK